MTEHPSNRNLSALERLANACDALCSDELFEEQTELHSERSDRAEAVIRSAMNAAQAAASQAEPPSPHIMSSLKTTPVWFRPAFLAAALASAAMAGFYLNARFHSTLPQQIAAPAVLPTHQGEVPGKTAPVEVRKLAPPVVAKTPQILPVQHTPRVGQSADEVVAILGKPQSIGRSENTVVYVFRRFKVSFVDDHVTGVERISGTAETSSLPLLSPPTPSEIFPPRAGTIKIAQTIDEVVAILGKPKSILTIGSKSIYVFSGLEVVFVDGRVTDIH